MSVFFKAFAKVNIGLRILPKSKDSVYHKIESIFQTINFFDEIEADFLRGSKKELKIECISSIPNFCLPKENTFSKTFEAFCDFTGIENSVFVKVKKNLPSGGGLGGGSSDSAAFLRALCKLNNFPLEKKLADFAANRVGSDVFFFANIPDGQGAAKVSGRGEIVEPIKMRGFHFALIVPNVFSSTKDAYAEFDLKGGNGEFLAFSEYEREYNSNVSNWRFSNSFTPILSNKFSEIQRAIDFLKKQGAQFCDMSGSGSCVFGIFDSLEKAKNAVEFAKSENFYAVLA